MTDESLDIFNNTTENINFTYRNMLKVFQCHVITNQKLRWFSLNVTLTQTSFNYSASPVSNVTMATFEGSGKILVRDDELERETVASFRNTSRRVHAIFLFFSWRTRESGLPLLVAIVSAANIIKLKKWSLFPQCIFC